MLDSGSPDGLSVTEHEDSSFTTQRGRTIRRSLHYGDSCLNTRSSYFRFAAASSALVSLHAMASQLEEAEALNSLRSEIRASASACADETINPAASSVRLSQSVDAVRVVLTSSKGVCFGQAGQNTYLVVYLEGRWWIALSTEPGDIRVGPLGATEAATVSLYSIGSCQIDYIWSGDRYVSRPSANCRGLLDPNRIARTATLLTTSVTRPSANHVIAPATSSLAKPLEPTYVTSERPIEALSAIIALTDQHRLPTWSSPDFAIQAAPYLTIGFLSAIAHGNRVARRNHLNIWDGDIISGASMMVRTQLWKATVVEQLDGVVLINANLSCSEDARTVPIDPRRATMHYWMKNENGAWKIDDLQPIVDLSELGPATRAAILRKPPLSAKRLFSNPEQAVR